ncbi:MAG: 50S ribosomal protein L22 [Lachnospiraceae bacterium]|nr:50S ribosomal protein L22 [Lachnospiraceae bacterium]
MSKGHRTQIKRERNEKQVDKRPSAKLSNARVSSRKAGFVLDAIRGKGVSEAIGIVTYSPRYASRLIKKLIESAVANAKNNNNMDEEKLYVAECFAGNATNYKRMHPRAQGRAYSILKRNSHITIILDEKKELVKETPVKATDKKEVVEGGNNGAKG